MELAQHGFTIDRFLNPIPIDDLLAERERLLQECYRRECGQEVLDSLLGIHGTLNEYIHHLGVQSGLYVGRYLDHELPQMRADARGTPCDDRYIRADGFRFDLIGRPTKRGFLLGPFNEATGHNDKPYRVLNHDLVIRNGYNVLFQEGYTSLLNAMISVYGIDLLDGLIAFDERGRRVTNLKDLVMDSRLVKELYPFIDQVKIEKAFFVNLAGGFIIKGMSERREWDDTKKRMVKVKGVQAVYDQGSVKQVPLFIDGQISFLGSAGSSGGAPNQGKRINVQFEFLNYNEITKQSLAYLILLTKGRGFAKKHGHCLASPGELVIRIPKDYGPHEHMDYLKLPDDIPESSILRPGSLIRPATFHTPLEDPDNLACKYILGATAYLRFVLGLNQNEVDYLLTNQLWDLALTPRLLVQLVNQQEDITTRFRRTAYATGAAYNGQVYPSFVQMPMPSATIKIFNGQEEVPAVLTFWASRMHELFPCQNPNCLDYKSYFRRKIKGELMHDCLTLGQFICDHADQFKVIADHVVTEPTQDTAIVNSESSIFYKRPSGFVNKDRIKKMNRLLGEIMAAEDEHEKSALIAQLEAIEPRVRCRAHDRFKYQCPDCT